jgi:hypothetical protein
MLPLNVIALIKEYSRPLTRPDWKTKPVMSLRLFYNNILYHMFHDSYSIKTIRYLPTKPIVNMLKFVLNGKGIVSIKYDVYVYGPYYVIKKYNITPEIIYTLDALSFKHNM